MSAFDTYALTYLAGIATAVGGLFCVLPLSRWWYGTH